MTFSFNPDEFIVEEIASDGTIFEIDKEIPSIGGIPSNPAGGKNEFSWFILQKRGWNTQQALEALAKKIGVSKPRFNSAGTKDRNATTTQLCSVFGVPPERILGTHVKDVKINGAWPASEKIKMGNLAGNRFTVMLNRANCGIDVDFGDIGNKAGDKGDEITNYFGSQRFGSLRGNTHLVGYDILLGDCKAAAINFLCCCGQTQNQSEIRNGEIAARKKLEGEMDFSKALEYFPRWLKYERAMLHHLSKLPNDFVGAIRTLPRPIALFFIHAAQSDIFNSALAAREKAGKLKTPNCGEKFLPFGKHGFPNESGQIWIEKSNIEEIEGKIGNEEGVIAGGIVGYETNPADGFTKAACAERGISSQTFLIKSMPELSSKGGFRPLWVRAAGFDAHRQAGGAAKISFSLPSGSYATVALGQILHNQAWNE